MGLLYLIGRMAANAALGLLLSPAVVASAIRGNRRVRRANLGPPTPGV